jgi:hypothetical protein
MPTPSQEIDEMIAKTTDWRGPVLAKLRKLIHEADPDITEEVKWKRPSNPSGVPVFEHGGIVCIAGLLKERVRLTFGAGTSIPDPHKLFNAMLIGKSRAIDFSKDARLDEPAIKAMVKAAVALNLAKAKPAKAGKK